MTYVCPIWGWQITDAYEGPDQLALLPSWFWSFARWHVLMDLARGPHLAEAALMRPEDMTARLKTFSMDMLGELIQEVDPSEPASVALCEVLFCAIGRRLYDHYWGFLGMVSKKVRVTVARSWDQQGKVAIEVDGRPCPRLGGSPGFITQWTAAALTMSNTLHKQRQSWACDPESALAPWSRPGTEALAAVLQSFDIAPTFPAHQLFARMVQRIPGLPITTHTALPLLVEHLARGEVIPREILDRLEPSGTTAIHISVGHWMAIRPWPWMIKGQPYDSEIVDRDQQASSQRLARATAVAIWTEWLARIGSEREPKAEERFVTHALDLKLMVDLLPASTWDDERSGRLLRWVLSRRESFHRYMGLGQAKVLPFSLPEPAQRAVIRAWDPGPVALYDLDLELLAESLGNDGIQEEHATAIWEHRPEACLAALRMRTGDTDQDRCGVLLRLAPDSQRENALVVLAPVHHELKCQPELRTWAWTLVGRRAPGWRTLWTWLE